MSCRPRPFAAALVLLVACAAPPATASSRVPSGPLPVRNFQPVQLLFPGPRHAAAGVLPAGEWRIGIELAESNTLNRSRDEASGTLIELDLETTRAAVRATRGLGGGWQVAVELPYVVRWGGWLDRPIELVERSVDQLNPTRDALARGRTRLRYERFGRTVFAADGPRAGIGDAGIELARGFGEPGPKAAGWGVRGGVELPTGDEQDVFGSGGTDLWIGGVHTRPLGAGRLSINLNLVLPEDVWERAGVETSAFATGALAWVYPWRPRTALSVQLGYYGSPFGGTGTEELELTLWDLSASAVMRLGGGWSWRLGGVQNLVYQSGADFTLLSRLVWTGR